MLIYNNHKVEIKTANLGDQVVLIVRNNGMSISVPLTPNELDIMIRNLQKEYKEIKK